MTMLLCVVLLAVLAVCNGVDVNTKLQQAPPPMKGLRLETLLGRWFIQFRKAPCAAPSLTDYQDYETTLLMDGKDSFTIAETMRNVLCNTVLSKIYFTAAPGVFTYKYPIGDLFSGSYIIPATDYKTFIITYGCSKMSVFGNKCDDPWLGVSTRMPFPDKQVIAMINQALMSLFGVTVDQFKPVIHRQSCSAKAPHKGKARPYSSQKSVPFKTGAIGY